MILSSDDAHDLYQLWWEESDPETAGRYMVAIADRIYHSESERDRRAQHLLHAKLFANQDLASIYDCRPQTGGLAGVYLSVNVTESCANTLAAKMTRTRVRPNIMTERGSRRLQQAAEMGTDFMDGVYHASELHEAEGEQMFTDGELFGNGIAHTADNGNREIVVERALPQEMLADRQEEITAMRWRSLQTLYRYKFIHRQALYRMRGSDGEMFGDDPVKRAAIKNAGTYSDPEIGYSDDRGQMVAVRFGWRLPSSRNAGDGRYIVAIEGATLFSKVWTRMRFPFDLFTFQRKPVGIWGRSLAEQLVPVQLKINEELETIDQGQNLNARVNLLYQDGAIDPEEWDNGFGRLIKLTTGHTMSEVKELVGTGASKEMYDDLETWIRRAYEITGISMLSATAEKPEGITSAVALRELLDREDLRFSALGKRWERFHRDIGETILDTAAEMSESGGKLVVQVPGDKWVKSVDFAELKLDRQKHVVTVAAASALPTTPAARKQYADDLLERQAITMARYLEIIDESGDVRGVTSMVTAIQESIDLDVEDILEDAKWRAPEKLRDPALARDTAIAAYAKAVHEDVPEKNLEMLRRYILLATRMASTTAPAGQAADQSATAEQVTQAPQQPPGAVNNGSPESLPPDLAAAAPAPAPPVTPVQ